MRTTTLECTAFVILELAILIQSYLWTEAEWEFVQDGSLMKVCENPNSHKMHGIVDCMAVQEWRWYYIKLVSATARRWSTTHVEIATAGLGYMLDHKMISITAGTIAILLSASTFLRETAGFIAYLGGRMLGWHEHRESPDRRVQLYRDEHRESPDRRVQLYRD